MTAENRKPHLQRLDLVFERSPIYFVTACMQDRRKLLATAAIHETFLRFAREGPARGAWVGAYVLMADHLHVFVATDDEKITLSDWMKSLKNTISKALRLNGVASHIGKRHFSITCYGATSRTQKNGTMF